MAYRYRDIQEINHQILMDVRQQNAEIKALIQTRMRALLLFCVYCMFQNFSAFCVLSFIVTASLCCVNCVPESGRAYCMKNRLIIDVISR